jgi:ABC-type uncharacterized transport system auxiliary subunit
MTTKTTTTVKAMRRQNACRGLSFFAALLALLGGGLIFSGCGATRPVKYYVLDPGTGQPPAPTSAPAKYPVTILVARVASAHLYHDDRLVYGSGAVELGTYEYQRWAEPPAEMLQDTLVSTLRATGEYRSVSAIASNLRGQYILHGRLYALDEVDNPAISARFSMGLELFDAKNGVTVWTGSYSHDAPVSGKSVADVVQALDENVRTGLNQLAASLGEYFASHPPESATAR